MNVQGVQVKEKPERICEIRTGSYKKYLKVSISPKQEERND